MTVYTVWHIFSQFYMINHSVMLKEKSNKNFITSPDECKLTKQLLAFEFVDRSLQAGVI